MAQQQILVSVLGCGIMGSAIARRSQRMGLHTIACDRNFERARSVGEGVEPVEHLLGAVNRFGPGGRRTRMKLVMNAWLAALMEGLAETLTVAGSLDILAQEFEQVIAGGPLAPAWAIAKLHKIEAGETKDTEFPRKWADKDVHLALDAVNQTKPRLLPELESIAEARDRAVAQGLGDYNASAAYLALQTPR